MDIRDLSRLDLNLLVALEALLEERSVSKAAERLYVTQSAMSKTLGRLRDLFDDPLLVRKGAAMQPTPRAEQLALQLPAVLFALQEILQPKAFDPMRYEGVFQLEIPEHIGIWLLPRLTARLSRSAPKIRLKVLANVDQPFDLLNNGRLDFSLQAERMEYPCDLRLTTLGFAPPMLLAREGHPLVGKEVSWSDFLIYPHVQLIIDELADIHFLAPAESAFMRHMETAVPALHTDQLLTALQVVRESDYLFPAPALFMEQADLNMGLVALPFPGEENISVKHVLVDHERFYSRDAHDFVYRSILAVIDEFRAKYSLQSLAQLREQEKLAY